RLRSSNPAHASLDEGYVSCRQKDRERRLSAKVPVTELFGTTGIVRSARHHDRLRRGREAVRDSLSKPRNFRAIARTEKEPIRPLPIDAEYTRPVSNGSRSIHRLDDTRLLADSPRPWSARAVSRTASRSISHPRSAEHIGSRSSRKRRSQPSALPRRRVAPGLSGRPAE